MTGSVLYPQALEGKKLPTIILSHSWGGTAAMLRPQAERFAQAGYFVLVFDYRGWGESYSRWVRDESATSSASARRELREEELFDIREHGELAFERAAEPKKRVVIPGITHYGIYTTAREQSIDLAIEWMDQYLKGAM